MAALRDAARAIAPASVRRAWKRWSRFGWTVECPVCGRRARTWVGAPHQPWDLRCPACDAYPRHRVLWVWLSRVGLDLRPGMRVLHLAPEPGVRRRLVSVPGLSLVTLDLFRDDVSVRADVTRLPFRSASFDVVLCNHVLEHVPDDRAAMHELARVTAAGGWATLLIPVDISRPTTFEDPSIVSPDARHAAFGQFDHVRLYGRDYVDRLAAAGWSVEHTTCREVFDDRERLRWGLFDDEVLYLGRRG